MAARLASWRTLTTTPLSLLHSRNPAARTNTTSGSGFSPINDPSPNQSKPPPKETNLLVFDDCDFQHWLVLMKFPKDPKSSEEEMISTYVKTLASVVGSEEEAKKKIYSVVTTTPSGAGFGCLISEELADKLKVLLGVLWVFADSYIDVPNKDYGGDLFVDGKAIPRPQYRHNERRVWKPCVVTVVPGTGKLCVPIGTRDPGKEPEPASGL